MGVDVRRAPWLLLVLAWACADAGVRPDDVAPSEVPIGVDAAGRPDLADVPAPFDPGSGPDDLPVPTDDASPADAPAPLSLIAADPTVGRVEGGETVTLTGTGFRDGMAVWFGDAPSPAVFVLTGELANVVTPAHPPATVAIRATLGDASVALEGAYSYEAMLRVDDVEPAAGSSAGGRPVTVRGAGFREGLTLLFGGREAVQVRVGDDGTLLALTPPHDPGPVAVTVIQGVDRVRLEDAYTYEPAPVLPSDPSVEVGAVEPPSGSPAGGTPVRIMGAGFQPGSTVRFGGLPATGVVWVNESTIRAVTPPGSPGPVDVAVRSGSVETVLRNGFEYDAGDVGILALEPADGSWAGGTWVRLWGRGLSSAKQVFFAGVEAPQFRVRSSILLEVRTPRSATAGPVPVMVLGDGGALAETAFRYFDPRQAGGGTWGGPVRGDLNVTVLNGQTGKGVPGAYVILGADLHGPFQGLADDRGQVTFSDFGLAGRQTVHATGPTWSAATIAGFDARNATLYVNPPPSPESPGQPPGGETSSPCMVEGRVKDFDKWFLKPPGVTGEIRVECWTPMSSMFGGSTDPGPGAICDEDGRFTVRTPTGVTAIVCGLVVSDVPGVWYPLRIGVVRNVTCTKDQQPAPVEVSLDHPTDAELWVNPGPLPTWPSGTYGPSFLGGYELGDEGWLDLLKWGRPSGDGRWVFPHQPRDFDGDLAGRGYGFYTNMSVQGSVTGAPYATTLRTDVPPPADGSILVPDPAGFLPVATTLRRPVTAMAELPGGEVLVLDNGGGVYRFDGTELRRDPVELPLAAFAVAAFDDDGFVAAGAKGLVWQVRGTEITPLATGAGATDLTALDGPGMDDFHVGGAGFLMRWDGIAFHLEALPGATDVRALRRYPDGQVVTVGFKGAVAMGRAGEVFGVLRPTTADLYDIDGPRDDTWIAGGRGTLVHLQDDDLTVYEAPTDATFRGVLRLGYCDVLAFGSDGSAWHFDCQSFTDRSRPDLSMDLLAGAIRDGEPVLAGRRWAGLPTFLAFPQMSDPLENEVWGRTQLAWSFPPAQEISYTQVLLTGGLGSVFWNVMAGGDVRVVPLPDFLSAIGYSPIPAGQKRLNLTSVYSPGFRIDRYTSSDVGFYARPSYSVWYGIFQ